MYSSTRPAEALDITSSPTLNTVFNDTTSYSLSLSRSRIPMGGSTLVNRGGGPDGDDDDDDDAYGNRRS